MADKKLSIERLWKLKRPSSVAISRDGSLAACALTEYSMKENKGNTAIWLLSTFGGKPRKLTAGGAREGEPRFSPDGGTLAFVARRDPDGAAKEEPQIWLIDTDGGEARRLTDLATGVGGIKWFPDGKRIAFISWVWPDTKGNKRQAARYKTLKESKVKAHVIEHSQYRFWDHWITDGRVPHVFVVDIRTAVCTDLFADTPYQLEWADADATMYDISPDGGSITFGHDPAPDKRLDHEFDLVELHLKSGKFRNLTADVALSFGMPAYSPDGNSIACVTRDLARHHNAPSQLTLVDRKTGRYAVISASWDRGVNTPLCFAEDGQSIIFTAEDNARQHVWQWNLASAASGQAPEKLVSGGTVAEFATANGTVAFVRHNMDTPPRVFALRQGIETPLENFNGAELKQLSLGRHEEVRFAGWEGREAHMWVIYPPGFDPKKKYPILHSIHGGPHTASADGWHFRWNNHAFAAQGYVVCCVNYHGSSSFGFDYMNSITNSWGIRETADIEAATDWLLKKSWSDPRRVFASGGSYGGYMVAWMNGNVKSDRYRAYICHAGCFDWVSMNADDVPYWHSKELGAFYWDDPQQVEKQNPRSFVAAMQTPTLVMHGALDYRVPDTQGLQYYNTLRTKGVPARLVYFPDENHWILKPQNSVLWYGEFFSWLRRFDAPARKAATRRSGKAAKE